MLDCVGGAPEEVRPERARDEVQEGDDAGGTRGEGGGGAGCCGGGAVEEEGEEALAEGVAEGGEPGLVRGVLASVVSVNEINVMHDGAGWGFPRDEIGDEGKEAWKKGDNWGGSTASRGLGSRLLVSARRIRFLRRGRRSWRD